jgi:SAM-dependent methyltransferase
VAKRKRAAPDADLPSALQLLRARRAPYDDLLAAIVADTLARFPPAAAGAVVEIGAGAGQLREWLPPPLRARTVHTDPSHRALRLLRAAAPDADARPARAERLPFADGACAAVIGLCAFDAVLQASGGDPMPAVREAARVLAPGGRFLHLLDMATLLEQPFAKLAASDLIPIPNVFGDPGDTEWPLDILLLPRDRLEALLDLAERAGHPLTASFGDAFAPFLQRPFDADAAAASFRALASSGERRQALQRDLASASRLAVQNGHAPLDPLPFHSGKYLQSVLDTAFRESGAFQIELSEIVVRSAWSPRAGDRSVRYRSLCLGHQRVMDVLPNRLLTGGQPAGGDAPPHEMLMEAGVFVFAARRA